MEDTQAKLLNGKQPELVLPNLKTTESFSMSSETILRDRKILNGRLSGRLASLASPELGTAQPQLVLDISYWLTMIFLHIRGNSESISA